MGSLLFLTRAKKTGVARISQNWRILSQCKKWNGKKTTQKMWAFFKSVVCVLLDPPLPWPRKRE